MYQVYLGRELLPVAPAKMTVKIENKNKTLTLINEGEINVLKQAGLSQITFGFLLPNQPYPFAEYPNGFQAADYYLTKLEALKTGQKPFCFQVLRAGTANFQSSFTVSLEDYEITEDVTNYGSDVYVTVSLLQYRSFVTKTLTFSASDSTAAISQEDRPTTGKESEQTYTVKSGDCLWNIAKKFLGNGSRYTELIALNLDTLDADARKHGKASSSNGYWLFAGTVLKLPAA